MRRPRSTDRALAVALAAAALVAASCSAAHEPPYRLCGAEGSRYYIEATVDGEPFSGCWGTTESDNLRYESRPAPWHRIIDVFAPCTAPSCDTSPAALGIGALCSARHAFLINIEVDRVSTSPVTSFAIRSTGFTDPTASVDIFVSRPDIPNNFGMPSTCENGGWVAQHVSGGQLSVTQPGDPGDVVVIEVSDVVVPEEDAPGHHITIDYARWEFVLNPLSVSP